MRRLRPRIPDGELDCRAVRRLMHGFLDGEIPADQAHRVAAHLDACEHCGVDADVLRRVKDALATLRAEPDAAQLDRLADYADRVASGEA